LLLALFASLSLSFLSFIVWLFVLRCSVWRLFCSLFKWQRKAAPAGLSSELACKEQQISPELSNTHTIKEYMNRLYAACTTGLL
jgi:hypothetical protein